MSGCFNFAPGTSFSSNTTACDMLKRLREDTDRKWPRKVITYIRFIRQQSNWSGSSVFSPFPTSPKLFVPAQVYVVQIAESLPPVSFSSFRLSFNFHPARVACVFSVV
ncbi:hypothetical protein PoB_001071000 [Plakobranchus ocellatus]|uniref:Uncharacterized protein n=1 Tax=Plakobranchus ocellatus TaxID=259542 RepID=A0AAV3YP19_9GAST|nr:hypothetical protein PoB_001071000 [Plakobranchus ocellatus]